MSRVATRTARPSLSLSLRLNLHFTVRPAILTLSPTTSILVHSFSSTSSPGGGSSSSSSSASQEYFTNLQEKFKKLRNEEHQRKQEKYAKSKKRKKSKAQQQQQQLELEPGEQIPTDGMIACTSTSSSVMSVTVDSRRSMIAQLQQQSTAIESYILKKK